MNRELLKQVRDRIAAAKQPEEFYIGDWCRCVAGHAVALATGLDRSALARQHLIVMVHLPAWIRERIERDRAADKAEGRPIFPRSPYPEYAQLWEIAMAALGLTLTEAEWLFASESGIDRLEVLLEQESELVPV